MEGELITAEFVLLAKCPGQLIGLRVSLFRFSATFPKQMKRALVQRGINKLWSAPKTQGGDLPSCKSGRLQKAIQIIALLEVIHPVTPWRWNVWIAQK